MSYVAGLNQARFHDSGQFTGQIIRTELVEIQQADRGRKCAVVDKRVLDPPPVVQLRFFILLRDPQTGMPIEVEVEDYSTIRTAGMVCGATLISTSNDRCSPPEITATLLTGSKYVQPTLIAHPETGRDCLLALFSNLSVKQEGDFYLHYQMFDLMAPTIESVYSVQAECDGGTFRVYSSNSFPGLEESTALTKHLARLGERVNVRQHELKKFKRK